MRGSILHPETHRARLTGIATIGFLAFLIGALFIVSPWSRDDIEMVSHTVETSGLEHIEESSCPVYLLDEERGEVNLVGTFESDANGGRINLEIPAKMIEQQEKMAGQYWPGNSDSYIPHFRFVFNDRLQTRLQRVSQAAWEDDEVQEKFADFNTELFRVFSKRIGPQIKKLLDAPGIKQEIVDVVITTFAEKRGRDDENAWEEFEDLEKHDKFEDSMPRTTREAWANLQDTVIRHVTDIDAEEWTAKFLNDEQFQNAFDELTVALEPHIRKAMDEILWYESPGVEPTPEGTPNARLIWIARRVIFGQNTDAILLFKDPAGMPLSEVPFICREAK